MIIARGVAQEWMVIKMNKGDKYIVEIDEVQIFHDDNGKAFELGKVKGFHALTLDEVALKKLEPVRRGCWKTVNEEMGFSAIECSECGHEVRRYSNYCPFCGARMDGDNND